ncbi:MAG: hypothetical protein JNM00_06985 [Flavobacteriales bacterium]|nr:hypothetical protein [Flavobacteriales bacterium]
MIFDTNQLITAGKVVKHQGFEGIVIVVLDHPAIKKPKKDHFLYIDHDGHWIPYKVLDIDATGDSYFECRLFLVDSEDKARQLSGRTIAVEPDMLRKKPSRLSKGLVGFVVYDAAHRRVGEIIAMEDIPGNPLLKVKHEKGEMFIPAADEWVISADEQRRELVLQLPEGLLDL